jgi:hypothetical protein
MFAETTRPQLPPYMTAGQAGPRSAETGRRMDVPCSQDFGIRERATVDTPIRTKHSYRIMTTVWLYTLAVVAETWKKMTIFEFDTVRRLLT